MNFFVPLLLTTVLLPTISLSVDPIAIDPERSQLLQDALDWMTFRKDGQLLSSADPQLSAQFLSKLKLMYTTDKYYRAFVIAFNQGVLPLPRMTLGENEACDPAYTLEYKHPLNYSVTWYHQKDFTFESYKNIDDDDLPPFCDYRQGLICKYKTKQCGCPEGAVMTLIEPGISVKRCQLKPNEICGLIDLAHGNDPTHPLLQKFLHELVFNLEKPPSCQPGSQCRFKKGESRNYPKCVTGGPWDTTITDLDFGDECAIGLLASPGGCKVKSDKERDITALNGGWVCYNHGPPRNVGRLGPGDESKMGFCSTEFGPLGVTQNVQIQGRRKEFDPLVAPFIHPRSVPIKGHALRSFFKDDFFINDLFICLIAGGNNHAQAGGVGDACSTSKTVMAEKAWKSFISLEGLPPSGQEFVVASVAEVRAKVQEIFTACQKPAEKFCQVYTFHTDRYGENRPSLKCVAQGTPDANGNDGKCQKGGNVDMTQFDKDFETYLDDAEEAAKDVVYQNHFSQSILDDNPEPPCDPLKGALPPQTRTNVVDTLEGNFCPEGSVCYEDYSNPEYYDIGNCNLDPSLWRQRFACHDVNAGLIKCEKEVLDKKVEQAIENLDKHAKLKDGAKCDYQFEKVLRKNDKTELEKMSPYVVLNRIAIRGEICDKMGRNLECSTEGVCQCMGNGCTEPVRTTRKPTTGTGTGEGIKPANKYSGATGMVALDWQVVIIFGCGTFILNS